MARVLLDIAVSLDGLICGPGGADGGLYDWYFNPTQVSRPVVDELVSTTGGDHHRPRRLRYGGRRRRLGRHAIPGAPFRGDPPTTVAGAQRHDRIRLRSRRCAGRNQLAREAAGDRYATIGGGADLARQCLAERLVDEVQLHVVPVVLGDGTPLFDRSGVGWHLTKTRVVDAPNVTHLRYRVDRPA